MAKRSAALELAILGVLAQTPQHGYELRKRLISVLGLFSTISYGALYPTLRSLVERGLLVEQDEVGTGKYPKRTRITYALTTEGQTHFDALVADAGPGAWDDDTFAVRMSLFGQTEVGTRIHILQGRRSRLEERLDNLQNNLAKGRERLDSYTLELQQHGLDALEREVRWLNELISREEAGGLDIALADSSRNKSVRPARSNTRKSLFTENKEAHSE
ncbi:MAG: PadR family transcriptional regulator [Actinomycetes bacterium]